MRQGPVRPDGPRFTALHPQHEARPGYSAVRLPVGGLRLQSMLGTDSGCTPAGREEDGGVKAKPHTVTGID